MGFLDKNSALSAADSGCPLSNNGFVEYRDDEDVVLAAVAYNVTSMGFASQRIKKNKEIAMRAVKINGVALCYVSDELRDDEDVVLLAVKHSGFSFRNASERLKAHRKIVLAAVACSGAVLVHVNEKLKDDEEVVAVALRNDSRMLRAASQRIKLLCEKQQSPVDFLESILESAILDNHIGPNIPQNPIQEQPTRARLRTTRI